jgi:hypothetical protein
VSAAARAMQTYFTDRLIDQHAASRNTIGTDKVTDGPMVAYAPSTRKTPGALDIAYLDACRYPVGKLHAASRVPRAVAGATRCRRVSPRQHSPARSPESVRDSRPSPSWHAASWLDDGCPPGSVGDNQRRSLVAMIVMSLASGSERWPCQGFRRQQSGVL